MASHSAVSFEHGEGEDDYLQQRKVNLMRRIIVISKNYTVSQHSSR